MNDKNLLRNGCEVLRNIFWYFGVNTSKRMDYVENKLVSKLISTFIPYSSFVNKQESMNSTLTSNYSDRAKNNSKLLNLINRCR
jgi:hypothetical protein